MSKNRIGEYLYFAGYDGIFPDMSAVSAYKILDKSKMGHVKLAGDVGWIDPNDPDEMMFSSERKAVECLRKIIGDDNWVQVYCVERYSE